MLKIAIHKTFTDKASGTTCFAGSTPTVTPDLAIAAVLANATDDPAAVSLADAAGAKTAAAKGIDALSAKDAKKELKRLLAGKPDAALEAERDDLVAKVKALTTETAAKSDELATLTTDVETLLTALEVPAEGDISDRLAAGTAKLGEIAAQLALSGTGENANEEAMTKLLAAYNAAAPADEQVETLGDLTAVFVLAGEK